MKSNGLLKWLLVPVLLLGVWVGVRLTSRHPSPSPPQRAPGRPLSRAEMADLGIPADTPRDTMATLVGQVKHLRGELDTALNENRTETADNGALRQKLTSIDAQVQAALHAQADHWQRESARAATDASNELKAQGQIENLKDKIDAITHKSDDADLPIGLGLREGESPALNGPTIQWIEPLSPPAQSKSTSTASPNSQGSFHFATGFGNGNSAGSSSASASDEDRSKTVTHAVKVATRSSIPVYTVPANSTLMGSVAMTALIGRIPINGTVEDPYPFKVLIGAQNLTANGIELPNLAGAVMSGTASGDWTLSCVRGRITSVTFVFRDGTVRTVPAASAAGADGGSSAQAGLGWISDPYGIPCVSGERRSNAKQYLTSQMLITAAGAGAASLIRSQDSSYSYVAGNNGTSLGTVGISGNEAMGRILAGGVEQMSQWVNKLYGQAFAAVYVPPGARVAVHIVRPIDIDYNPHGRRVRYEKAGGENAPDLD